MTLKNVTYVRVKDMTLDQKKLLNLDEDLTGGLIAIETHNSIYKQVPVIIKKGIISYILNGN